MSFFQRSVLQRPILNANFSFLFCLPLFLYVCAICFPTFLFSHFLLLAIFVPSPPHSFPYIIPVFPASSLTILCIFWEMCFCFFEAFFLQFLFFLLLSICHSIHPSSLIDVNTIYMMNPKFISNYKGIFPAYQSYIHHLIINKLLGYLIDTSK